MPEGIVISFTEYEKLKSQDKILSDSLPGSSIRIRERDIDGWAWHSLLVLTPDETTKRLNELLEFESKKTKEAREKYNQLRDRKRNLWQRIFNIP